MLARIDAMREVALRTIKEKLEPKGECITCLLMPKSPEEIKLLLDEKPILRSIGRLLQFTEEYDAAIVHDYIDGSFDDKVHLPFIEVFEALAKVGV